MTSSPPSAPTGIAAGGKHGHTERPMPPSSTTMTSLSASAAVMSSNGRTRAGGDVGSSSSPMARAQSFAKRSRPAEGFGGKSVSFLGSCVLNFNNITGPGMVVLPLLFQQAGWLPAALGLTLGAVLSAVCATMLCEAMQRMPGNRAFQRRVEYCGVVEHYLGRSWHALVQTGFNAGLQASNIAAMVVTSQVLDVIVAHVFGTLVGISFSSFPPALVLQQQQQLQQQTQQYHSLPAAGAVGAAAVEPLVAPVQQQAWSGLWGRASLAAAAAAAVTVTEAAATSQADVGGGGGGGGGTWMGMGEAVRFGGRALLQLAADASSSSTLSSSLPSLSSSSSLAAATGAAASVSACEWSVVGGSMWWGPGGDAAEAACPTLVVTAGFILAMSVCVPLGHLNLEDNMALQWVSMAAQLGFSFVFLALFRSRLSLSPSDPGFCPGNGPARTPLLGHGWHQVAGVSMFAYAYVSTIPSWANEKLPGVSVSRAIWIPAMAGLALNLSLGLLGAWAYPLVETGTRRALSGADNIVKIIDGTVSVPSCPALQPSTMVRTSAYLWGVFGYLPGIPVVAIAVRYNLQSSRLVSRRNAFLVAVVAPWLVTLLCYRAQILLSFINVVALCCLGFVNFVIPPIVYASSYGLAPFGSRGGGGTARGALRRSSSRSDIEPDDDDEDEGDRDEEDNGSGGIAGHGRGDDDRSALIAMREGGSTTRHDEGLARTEDAAHVSAATRVDGSRPKGDGSFLERGVGLLDRDGGDDWGSPCSPRTASVEPVVDSLPCVGGALARRRAAMGIAVVLGLVTVINIIQAGADYLASE